jgi:hypothetical protein
MHRFHDSHTQVVDRPGPAAPRTLRASNDDRQRVLDLLQAHQRTRFLVRLACGVFLRASPRRGEGVPGARHLVPAGDGHAGGDLGPDHPGRLLLAGLADAWLGDRAGVARPRSDHGRSDIGRQSLGLG